MNYELILSFSLYFFVLICIGLYAHKANTNAADYMIGGRGLNYWVTAMSAHASDMSSWLFMAFPAAIFVGGMQQAWIGIGLTACMFLNWHYIAPRLRIETEKYNSYTLSCYFESRFKDKTGRIRIATAVLSTVFLSIYIAAGLIATGTMFERLFAIDYLVGISLGTFAVICYTYVGGYVAIAWVDLFQGIFLLAMLLTVAIFGFIKIDGANTIPIAVKAQGLSLSLFPSLSFIEIFKIALLSLGWGLGYFGMPHVLTKFMGISSHKEIYKSKIIGITWQTLSISAATVVSLVAIVLYGTLPQPENLFIDVVHDFFPVFIGGLILCGVLAATISTMDSQVLVLSSILTQDFYKKTFHPKASEETLLIVSRRWVIAICILSYTIALFRMATIYDTVHYAWSGLACTYGPTVFIALFSKRACARGIFAGITAGGFAGCIWPLINKNYFPGFDCPSIIVGYAVGFLVTALFSKKRVADASI